MHLNNAMALNNNLNKYFNHHEQASAMSAEAYARLNGKIAAVCVTSGPGGSNTLTGVLGAWQESIPMLILSGQVRYQLSMEAAKLKLRYRGVQEFDIVNSVKNMTKYSKMIKDPLSIKLELNKAIDMAISGRRGPAWLDIPLDVQSAIIEEEDLYPTKAIPKLPRPKKNDIIEILDILKNAKRPVILVGRGVVSSGNLNNFREFAKKLRIPVIAASLSLDTMYTDYDRYYGLSGYIGPRPGNFIVQNSDVILSIGCSLGFTMTGYAQELFAPKAFIISIDVDKKEFKKPGVRIDRLVHSDLKAFFEYSNKLVDEIEVNPKWISYCEKLKRRFSPFEPSNNISINEKVSSYFFWKKFEKYETSDSILAMGNNTANTAKLQIGIKQEKQRALTNKNCGSMGYDLPAAIGSSIAAGKKEIICVTGDGSIMMNLQELQTIRHYKLPIKIVVFSNDGYNSIRQTSKNFFDGKYIGCSNETGISFPDFNQIANSFGFKYQRCSTNAEVEEALQWFFNNDGNLFLEIMQRLDDPVTPKVMSRILQDGSFSTPALQDMYPFLDEEEYNSFMLW